MSYWRMRLRNGYGVDGGEDMWPKCKKEGVAAITYRGIGRTDMSDYSRNSYPHGWNEIEGGSAKGSIAKFAWDIRGGDTIYIADSDSHEIAGMGSVRSPIGETAYRFDAASPIAPEGHEPWCHLIDVDWDETFVRFPYENPRAPVHTVLQLNQEEIERFDEITQKREHLLSEHQAPDLSTELLRETAYTRYTPAAIREIARKHVTLSNDFAVWLKKSYRINVISEYEQIDAKFVVDGRKFLAEFKIAYHGNTKRAIREALGQILEYNHYPPRVGHDRWLLILDTEPSNEDRLFVGHLRDVLMLPLSLGWKANLTFNFDPALILGS